MCEEKELASFYCKIKGEVQMVGFRFFTIRQARLLNITGWVRNTYDGGVEVEAEGERMALFRFLEALKKGPPAARVDNIEVKWFEYKGKYKDFTVRY